MIKDMNALQRFGVTGRFGLAVLAAWPSLVLGLSLTGGAPLTIVLISILGLPLALLGAITWLRAGQRSSKVFHQKRVVTAVFAAIVAAGLMYATLERQPAEAAFMEDQRSQATS